MFMRRDSEMVWVAGADGCKKGWFRVSRETVTKELRFHLVDDDIQDAIAALWTAHRLARGEAKSLPEHPPTDSTGLPMRIVY